MHRRVFVFVVVVLLLGASVKLPGTAKVVSAYSDETLVQAVNPVFTSVYLDKLISEGSFGDHFGTSIAISGDTLVVGAPDATVDSHAYQGSAYVFVRSGSTWELQQQLIAPDGLTQDYFGSSVAISGDTVVVGAYRAAINDFFDQGAAYVYQRSGTTWELQQKLIDPAETQDNDWFGISVAIDGDTILVGEWFDDVGINSGQGSVLAFTRSGEVWSLQTSFSSSDGEAGDRFGERVALSGDTALVGVMSDAIGSAIEQGSAYIFVRDGTTWSQQAKLIASDGAMNDTFGQSVSLFGDTALVGAPRDDNGENGNQGSAYVFTRSGSTWNEQAHLFASDGTENDRFGTSVALNGDKALIGAVLDVTGKSIVGSAYVFTRDQSNWIEQDKLLAADGDSLDNFGNSAALSSATALVGNWIDTVDGNPEQGSVYIYEFPLPFALHLPMVIRNATSPKLYVETPGY
jgi:hypothetical protein